MLSVSVLFFYVYTYIMYTLIFIGLHILLICPSCRLTDCLRESICLSLEEGDEDLMVVSLGKLFLNATSMLKAFKSYCTRQVCHISYKSIFLYIIISVCPSLCMYVCTYVCMYLSIYLLSFFYISIYTPIHIYQSLNCFYLHSTLTGIGLRVAGQPGAGEGVAADLPQGLPDGEHRPQADEPLLFSHGKQCSSYVVVWLYGDGFSHSPVKK